MYIYTRRCIYIALVVLVHLIATINMYEPAYIIALFVTSRIPLSNLLLQNIVFYY